MPFRKLEIDSAAAPETITERIRAGIRGEPSLREYLRQMWDFKELAGPPIYRFRSGKFIPNPSEDSRTQFVHSHDQGPSRSA